MDKPYIHSDGKTAEPGAVAFYEMAFFLFFGNTSPTNITIHETYKEYNKQ